MQAVRNPRKVCSRLGIALAAMLVVVLGSQLLLTVLSYTFAPWFITNETGSWLLADASIYLFGAPVYLLILRTIPDGHEGPREKMPMNPWKYLLVLVVCLGVAYAASFVTAFFLLFVETLKNSPIQTPEFFTESNFLVGLFFGSVVPALGEEYLFRYCLRKKLKGSGDKIYILFSSLCFAVFHMNMSQLVFTFFVGAVFAWIYTQTGSIWYSVSLHFLFNTVSLLLGQIEEEFYSVMVAYVGLMFAFIAISVTTLVLAMRYVRGHLRPPEEPGWPYKAPPARYAAGPVRQSYGMPQALYGYAGAGYGAPGQPPYGYGLPPQSGYHQAPYGRPGQGGPLYGAPAPYSPMAYPQNPYNQPPYAAGGNITYGNFSHTNYQEYTHTGVASAWQQAGPAVDIPELRHAAYNNVPSGNAPPAYQNMRPVWPGQAVPGAGTVPGGAAQGPSLFAAGQNNSIVKTCFLNPGMIIYLLGGLVVILFTLLV